jgi:acetyl esterase/lipase
MRRTGTLPDLPCVLVFSDHPGAAGEVVPRVAELVGAEIARAGSRDTFVLGDSAGGQIALSSAIHLRDNNSEQPSRVFLIAPVLVTAMGNPGIAAVAPKDPWLSCAGIHVYPRHWRGHLSLDDPLVSPLSAALEGLTALTIFSGTRDILNPDARLLASKATAAGSTSTTCRVRGWCTSIRCCPTRKGVPLAGASSTRSTALAGLRR